MVVTKYLQCIQYADLEEKKIGDLKKKKKETLKIRFINVRAAD